MIRKLKDKFNYQKNMKEFYKEQYELFKIAYQEEKEVCNEIAKQRDKYEELLEASISELQYERLQKQHYHNVLDEVEILLKQDIDKKLILKLIENWKERGDLDVIIHNKSVVK